jgi:hypothetical protein
METNFVVINASNLPLLVSKKKCNISRLLTYNFNVCVIVLKFTLLISCNSKFTLLNVRFIKHRTLKL